MLFPPNGSIWIKIKKKFVIAEDLGLLLHGQECKCIIVVKADLLGAAVACIVMFI